MAKKDKPKRTPKAAVPGSVRRLTHTVLVGDHDTAEGIAYKVYGIAKKVFIQNTTFGRIPGVKGVFEAIAPDGKVLTSKRCFLPTELHTLVAAKMEGGNVLFGMLATVKGDDMKAEFFADPSHADPLAMLREQAESA